MSTASRYWVADDAPDFKQWPVGGKARALSILKQQGLPIPAWLTILPTWLTDSLANTPLSARAIEAVCLSEETVADLLAYVATTFAPGTRFAVRSSAVAEDHARHAFAGILHTCLDVPCDKLVEAIKTVWASACQPAALAYARQHGLSLQDCIPAVMIQAYLSPGQIAASGVAFSADPKTGNPNLWIVSATPQHNQGLVGGSDTGQTLYCWRNETVLYKPDEPPVLTDTQLAMVLDMLAHCTDVFGEAQDVEWALTRDNRPVLLQSRPVTALPEFTPPSHPSHRYDWHHTFTGETWPAAVVPLTASLARHNMAVVYGTQTLLGCPPKTSKATLHELCRGLTGTLQGRVVLNQTMLEQLWFLAPTLAYRFHAVAKLWHVCRAQQKVTDPFVDQLAELVAGLGRATGTMLGLPWHSYTICVQTRLDRLLHRKPNLTQTLQRMQRLTHGSVCYQFLLGACHHGLVALDRLTTGDCACAETDEARVFADLQRGLCTPNHQRLHAQHRVIEALHHHRDLVIQLANTLTKPSDEAVRDMYTATQFFPDVRQAVADFFNAYGTRLMQDYMLEAPSYWEARQRLVAQWVRLAQGTLETGHPSKPSPAHPRQLSSTGKGLYRFLLWPARLLLRSVGRWALQGRESTREALTYQAARLRQKAKAFGQRLVADGVLQRWDDMLFLSLPEWHVLKHAHRQAQTTYALKALSDTLATVIDERRQRFERHSHLADIPEKSWTLGYGETLPQWMPPEGTAMAGSCPDWLLACHIHQAPYDERLSPPNDPRLTDQTATGLGVSQGRVTGQTLWVDGHTGLLNPADLSGKILLAPTADPALVAYLPYVRGVVFAKGNMLSHAVIVARELQLPVVVGIDGLGDWVDSHETITLDATLGTLKKTDP
ncbi:MAG: hypothetical protein KC475_10760 [Cyanobacteria bacterium HKST-UBA03]|nr:hypothetical protein [Cyanobacteria bacterium HKST-UBA03]